MGFVDAFTDELLKLAAKWVTPPGWKGAIIHRRGTGISPTPSPEYMRKLRQVLESIQKSYQKPLK